MSVSAMNRDTATMPGKMQIALIDDDPAVLDSLKLYLERQGVGVVCYQSADAFLASSNETASLDCVVADVRMPGLSGLDLMRLFADEKRATPLILITGHGDVDMAVASVKLGAFDFIEKPFDEARLLESIRKAAGTVEKVQAGTIALAELRARLAGLSERQRQVFDLAAAGLSNKEIAARLGISFRTVENHRAWMMERMGVRNLAELVRLDMQINAKKI
jgi:FixJ family two-component response regulator